MNAAAVRRSILFQGAYILKINKPWKHDKEFDTKTLITDTELSADDIASAAGDDTASSDTKEAMDRRTISDAGKQVSEEAVTQIYEPRPLTPDDDIYEDIIEQFASAPTKPKYWFEEFGDYWSCSCGHINKGDRCKSCGLERELLRSLFILHKPAGAKGKLSSKLSKSAKEQIDKEEQQQSDRDSRRKKLEETEDGELRVMPIETDDQTDETASYHETTDAHSAGEPAAISAPNVTGDNDDADNKSSSPSGSKTDSAAAAPTDGKTPGAKPPAIVKSQSKPKDHRNRNFKIKIILAIIACLLMIGLAGFAIYKYMAAPAMKYQDALDLQADGKYEKAIEKFKAMGDYKDSAERIWECYCSLGDQYFEAGDFEAAIDTYNTALELKDDELLHDKIWQCYCGIGDKQLEAGKFEQAMETYQIAAGMKDSDEIQDKINLAKFRYVEAYQGDRTATVEKYMSELMTEKYPGIQEIYDEYYAWHVSIVANTSADDASTDVSTVSRKDTVYFHVALSGGEPSEKLILYYEVTWPNGHTEVYDLDSTWESGSTITARFQYPIPLFGKEGKLTFKLYDRSTNDLMGSDSVNFKN